MVLDLLRGSIPYGKDPHDWNSWDHYQTIHESRLSEHPFVVSFRDTPTFTMSEAEGDLYLVGQVHCEKGITLEVEKEFDIPEVENILRVRATLTVISPGCPGNTCC